VRSRYPWDRFQLASLVSGGCDALAVDLLFG
jgi:hypothetical protein